MLNINEASVESFHLKELSEKNMEADLLRLDKIHDVISGNKWFKLKYYLQEAIGKKTETILSFGGAYSNHIVAAACAAKMFGLKSIGIIRGEEPPELSHTLTDAKDYGMQLEFISRDEFKRKNETYFIEQLNNKFKACFIIPEGGAGLLGRKGSAEILGLVNLSAYSHILCAIGTGTMFAGIANASLAKQKIIGICVLKGVENLSEEIVQYIHPEKIADCEIIHEYHFGGYAKKNEALIKFMNSLYDQTKIPTDFVYTAKLMWAFVDLLKKKYFPSGSRLLIIHSGGLQGNLSLVKGTLNF